MRYAGRFRAAHGSAEDVDNEGAPTRMWLEAMATGEEESGWTVLSQNSPACGKRHTGIWGDRALRNFKMLGGKFICWLKWEGHGQHLWDNDVIGSQGISVDMGERPF